MSGDVVIIDRGFGNVCSVANAFNHLGFRTKLAAKPHMLAGAAAIILPGVGSYAQAMTLLAGEGMIDALSEAVLNCRVPFLGICLGMQLLAQDSDEEGLHNGLGWLPGHVRRLPAEDGLRLPHVGWNDVEFIQASPLFDGIAPGSAFYFDHSYGFLAEDGHIAATSVYGGRVAAVVQSGHIFGTQFHPEKSQGPGLALLENFARYVKAAPRGETTPC